ncbi:MAG: type III pantothenate kinase [Phycisphaeraceae bacterium]|nr:type III pantothenate kinase [Phycisphaerales bacterium]MCB9859109.1 type III pantothenate kinase [Phycisphaeraceae bacterium]
MADNSKASSQTQPVLLAVAVGNTRTAAGVFIGNQLDRSERWVNAETPNPADRLADLVSRSGTRAAAVASVNEPVAKTVCDALGTLLPADPGVFRIGTDLPIEIPHNLKDASTVGQDRLLCALGAYSRARQACIVVDTGTAVTINFVDGEGTFHGGAILPGLGMMLRSLHTSTAAIPDISPCHEPDAATPWGRDTADAIAVGVRAAIVGAVHELVMKYAEHYEGYPQVVATGGDAVRLFSNDDVVEHIVPDLQLLGIKAVCDVALAGEEEVSS